MRSLLSRQGLSTGTAKQQHACRIERKPHEWTLKELAGKLEMPPPTLYAWLCRGILTARLAKGSSRMVWIISADSKELARVIRGIAITGFAIEKEQGPVIEHQGGDVESSNLVLTNGTIELGQPGLAISNQTDGFIHVRNGYMRGATDLIKTGDRQAIKAVGKGWSVVESYTSVPGTRKLEGSGSYSSTNVIDGSRNQNELVSVRAAKASPPDFVASVVPSHIASFESKAVVSAVKFGANGDDYNDDTSALQQAIDAHDRVFLPAGTYHISKALRLRKNTQLFGVPGLRTHLEVGSSWKDRSSKFMIVSPDDADATTVVSDVSIPVPTGGVLGAVHWRAGRHSIVRNIAPAVAPRLQLDKPRVLYLIDGNGGGRWYRWEHISGTSGVAEDDSHILLIKGTTEPLSFYGVNPEHAGASMVTIDNARNVRMFGAKSEGRRAPTLVVKNSRNILVSAWMGTPRSGDIEYVRVENSSDIEFAGMARPGPASDPMLIEQTNEGRLTIGSNEYIALYRRGIVDLGAWSRDGVQNQAPVVDAGENQVITLAEELSLTGEVTDDGLPNDNVTLNWSVVSGPGVVYFINPNTVQTAATFSEIGTYELQLRADDGELSSSDRVIISVGSGYPGDPAPEPDPGPSEYCPIDPAPGQSIFNACYEMLGYTKPFSPEQRRDIKACRQACKNTSPSSDTEPDDGGQPEPTGESERFVKGKLLFDSPMDTPESVEGWKMEGPGMVDFRSGWMHMFSPNQKMHHVYWCPETFPNNFIAEWEAQNLETDAGLSIVFFAAQGVNGEDIFDPSLPKRNGQFKHYTRGSIDNYHISYYANTPSDPNRSHANLRKNIGEILVQQGKEGIGTKSKEIHKIQLVKDGPHIVMFIDERKVIDWTDNDKKLGPAHTDGKIGFRQMKWTHFRYRNFKVWSLRSK